MIKQTTVDGFDFLVDLDDGGIGTTLYNANTTGKDYDYCREKLYMQILNDTIRSGMVCVDIGANLGYATVFMLRNVGDDGYVYAIEPSKENLALLIKNLKLNNFSRYVIFPAVISNKSGGVDFWLSDKANLHSVNKHKNSKKKITLPSLSLNDFLQRAKYPNFLKMDIEGHEVKVLEGGLDYFTRNDGETHILMEVHPKEYNEDNDFSAILREYFNIGFKTKYLISTPFENMEPIVERGYKPVKVLKTDGWTRSLYKSIDDKDCIDFCKLYPEILGNKIVRSIMISRENTS